MSQFQILLNMLYERAVRSCFEKSMASLIQTLSEVTAFMLESMAKASLDQEIEEYEVMKMANDPVLAKRMEGRFRWKVTLVFSKSSGKVELAPPVS